MQLDHLKNFCKTTIDDMAVIQHVLKETTAIVDSRLFPLIEEGEKGNVPAMVDLWEMFAYGKGGVAPNLELAKRYWRIIQLDFEYSGNQLGYSNGLNVYAYLMSDFDQVEEEMKAYAKALHYMVENLPLSQWEPRIIHFVSDNFEAIQTKGDCIFLD